ncbi:MAG: hypothetical protein GY754_20655 [bacterium]|nr:hypothetical protein [bacterium]
MMAKEYVSDLQLEQYYLRELPAGRMKEIEQLLENDREIQKRFEQIEQSNREILEKYPPGLVAGSVGRLYETSEKEKRRKDGNEKTPGRNPMVLFKNFIFPVFSLGAVVIAFVLFLPGTGTIPSRDNGNQHERIRLKGSTRFFIYRKSAAGKERLKTGAQVKEKDLLQLAYISVKAHYGVILSIDGRKAVTLHYPASETGSTELEINKKHVLPNSYELDDAPDFERFFFITSRVEINARELAKAAEKFARSSKDTILKEEIPLDQVEQQSITVFKK